WIMFMLFLRALAHFTDQHDYGHDALVLLLTGSALVLVGALLLLGEELYVSEIRPQLDDEFVRIVDVGLYLIAMTWLVFLIRLILKNLDCIRMIQAGIGGHRDQGSGIKD